MKGVRKTARPRRLGLLTGVGREPGRAERRRYPYAVGDRIAGDLTVIGHLATGRVGHLYQVWSARDWCALTCKMLSRQYQGDRRASAALRREARILRKLQHPNLVRSFGQGEHEGLPYLLMEYLEGPSLFELIERRPARRLGVTDALRVAIHTGAGLYCLHRHGYVHLDLKPANLLLRDNVPVLVDFDAARCIDPTRRPSSPLGTAPYMAPEQVRLEPVGPTADVYGLGALSYELLTGRWPFEDVYAGEKPRSGDERAYPQLGSDLPPSPRDYNTEVSRSLAATILRCLAPDAEDRFQTMHALLLALVQELDAPVAFWPEGVDTERRREPRA